jgi:predicted permease
MAGWLRRLRARIKYRHFERELAREIDAHRALKTDEHRRHGASAREARQAAARDLGNVTLMREEARAVWIAPWLQSVRQDLRFAIASYRRQPLFTVGALLVLSLGTVLVTVGFSLAHAVFLRPWRVPDPSSVVVLRTTAATSQTRDFRGISLPEFRYLREHARAIDVLYTRRGSAVELAEGPRSLGRADAIYVSDNYFTALRIPMAAGRGFTAAENDYQTIAPVAVISDGLWRAAFNRDPEALGRTITAGRRQVTIVGIASVNSFMEEARSGFDLALPLTASVADTTPASLTLFTDPRRTTSVGAAAGRLAARASAETAATELSGLSRQFRSAAGLPAINVITIGTAPVDGPGTNEMWQAAQLVLLALLLVLFLACANVGNMLLARGLSRWREMAIRRSLGAGRARLVRQLVTESAVLSLAASAIGLAAAAAAPRILTRLVELDEGFDRVEFYALTMPVFLAVLAVAGATTAICGLAPALRVARSAPALADRHGPSSGGVRLRRLLLSAQIALATTLLVGAGLLSRAMTHALSVDPGFALDELQLISVELPRTTALSARRTFFASLDAELAKAGVPVAFVQELPLSDSRMSIFVRHERGGTTEAMPLQLVSPAFFDITGVRIMAGRMAEPLTAPREIVVSQAAARELWRGADPLGKTLLEGTNPDKLTPVVVVGIASDAAINALSEPTPIVYRAMEYSAARLLTRDGSPSTLERVRATAGALAPGTVVTAMPLRDQARRSLQRHLVGSSLAWAIGGLALVLATVGAIGVYAYGVEERRREIGIRLALGAKPTQVIGLVLRTSQATALAGLGAGLALSLALAPLLRSYLYGLSPFDVRAYLLIALILLCAAALASWLPARRAIRINPIETLRVD